MNWLPAIVDGGIPIAGGVLCTLYGYGILRARDQASRLAQSLKWLGPIVSLFGIWLLVDDLRAATTSGSASAVDLATVATEINKRLPMMVDGDTRLDNVKAGDAELAYYLTITDRSETEPGWEEFQTAMSDKLLGQACSSPDYKRLLTQGIQLRLVYRSKELAEVATVVIPPSHCGYKDRV
ncbi:MAG TPA: hypothetical protein VF502_05935 [Stellaceae bacterium]